MVLVVVVSVWGHSVPFAPGGGAVGAVADVVVGDGGAAVWGVGSR